MGHNKSFSVNDGFEFDEACFRKFYKPLSNLPTPPPSSRNSSATQSPRIPAGDAEGRNEEFLGKYHLAAFFLGTLAGTVELINVAFRSLSYTSYPDATLGAFMGDAFCGRGTDHARPG